MNIPKNTIREEQAQVHHRRSDIFVPLPAHQKLKSPLLSLSNVWFQFLTIIRVAVLVIFVIISRHVPQALARISTTTGTCQMELMFRFIVQYLLMNHFWFWTNCFKKNVILLSYGWLISGILLINKHFNFSSYYVKICLIERISIQYC